MTGAPSATPTPRDCLLDDPREPIQAGLGDDRHLVLLFHEPAGVLALQETARGLVRQLRRVLTAHDGNVERGLRLAVPAFVNERAGARSALAGQQWGHGRWG